MAVKLEYQRKDPCPPPPRMTRDTFRITPTGGGGGGGFYDLVRNLGQGGSSDHFPLSTDTNQLPQGEVIFKVRALA